ncbi:hypothetical protein BS17DRAFT_767555 [Gyrodon lividus]|nr:hypothetical protein BS17DRAFT_767555 [Gyrodon lividus]
MPQDSRKVRFTSEVPSPPKCLQRIYEADLSPKSSGEGSRNNNSTGVKPQAAKAPYRPISQLTIPAQPKPRKKHDSKATGYQGHPQDLVIPAAPKATGNCTVRPLSQCLSAKIVIPSGLKQARRTPATCQNILTLVLPTEPKTSNHKIDSVQSTPGPSNMVLALDILSGSDNIAMDVADVDPIPSQTHFSAPEPEFQQGSSNQYSPDALVLRSPTHWAMYRDILESGIRILDARDIAQAAPIGYQDNSELHKINYKEGLNDLIKRAMEDYQQGISAAFKHCRSVVEQQRWLLEELEKLQMEREKYAV